MAVLPFRWQGTTRTEQLRSLVTTRTQEWLRGWASTSPGFDCVVTPVAIEPPGANQPGEHWYAANVATGTLNVRTTASAFGQLGCLLAGTAGLDGQGIAAGIGRRAFTELIKTLASATGEDVLSELDAPPQSGSVEPRCGSVGFVWLLNGVRVELFFDAALSDSLLPKATAPTERLSPCREAILPSEVTLGAVLDLGKAALEDTITLQPGEIIKTNVMLDSIVNVRLESGETIFAGVLAAADGHRALRCVDSSHR